jgi:imidazolonepropionase-like amidohydrolase
VHLSLDPHATAAPVQQAKDDALRAAMSARAAAMLRAGITTARDLGGGTFLELELRDRIHAGALQGPRLLCAGQPITSPRGHCWFWGGEAEDLSHAQTVLERQVARGVDLIKVMATGGNLTPGSNPVEAQFDATTLEAIVALAARHDRCVAAHCHGTAGIRHAAHARVTTIEHCSWRGTAGTATDFDPQAAETLAARGVWVSPTLNSGWRRYLGQELERRMRENYARMRSAGVRLIASTDAGIPQVPHTDLPHALPTFAHFAGLSPVETLRAATSDCAAALGMGASIGVLAPGYVADLVLVEGDPLADLDTLARPAAVIKGGTFVH